MKENYIWERDYFDIWYRGKYVGRFSASGCAKIIRDKRRSKIKSEEIVHLAKNGDIEDNHTVILAEVHRPNFNDRCKGKLPIYEIMQNKILYGFGTYEDVVEITGTKPKPDGWLDSKDGVWSVRKVGYAMCETRRSVKEKRVERVSGHRLYVVCRNSEVVFAGIAKDVADFMKIPEQNVINIADGTMFRGVNVFSVCDESGRNVRARTQEEIDDALREWVW